MPIAAMRTSSARGAGRREGVLDGGSTGIHMSRQIMTGNVTLAPRSVLEVVLDLFSFSEINGILADIRGEIGNALEVAAHQEQLE